MTQFQHIIVGAVLYRPSTATQLHFTGELYPFVYLVCNFILTLYSITYPIHLDLQRGQL